MDIRGGKHNVKKWYIVIEVGNADVFFFWVRKDKKETEKGDKLKE